MKKLSQIEMEQTTGGRKGCAGKVFGTMLLAFLVGGPGAAVVAGAIVGMVEC